MSHPTQHIGQRVASWRRRRSMTQEVLARRVGRSHSWVDKIERGARRLNRLDAIYDLAQALRISVDKLIGPDMPAVVNPAGTSVGMSAADMAKLRAVLERYDQLDDRQSGLIPRTLAEVRKGADHAALAYHRCAYHMLVQILPDALRQAHAACRSCVGTPDEAQAHTLLSQLYQIASATLDQLGKANLAWLCADRAVRAAASVGDDTLIGSAVIRVSDALVAMGRHRSAQGNLLAAIERLADREHGRDVEIVVRGTLLLRAAHNSARLAAADAAMTLLDQADIASKDLNGNVRHGGIIFGCTIAQIRRAAVLLELGNARLAYRAAAGIDQLAVDCLPVGTRVGWLMVLAESYASAAGADPATAAGYLHAVHQATPEVLACSPAARRVFGEVLVRLGSRTPASLRDLAAQVWLETDARPDTSAPWCSRSVQQLAGGVRG